MQQLLSWKYSALPFVFPFFYLVSFLSGIFTDRYHTGGVRYGRREQKRGSAT
jgi:hypothetical protein